MGILRNLATLHENAKVERQLKLRDKTMLKDMPYFYGLLGIALSSGLSNETSIRCVSRFAPETLSDDMQKVVNRIDSGKTFRQALLPWEENENLRPVAHVLVESMESGTSSLVAIDSLTRDSISKVRRNAETSMKKLPIMMLFPLVLCILPAFVLLSILPTLISGFMSFNW